MTTDARDPAAADYRHGRFGPMTTAPPVEMAAPARARLRRYVPPALCILVYCVLAAFVYGVHPPATSATLPTCACGDIPPGVWFLAWPAYALAHGLNPLYSSWADYPYGVNLMNNTSTPLLGIVFAPFTLIFGVMSTYSLLMRAAFALSGISMCFVLRRWTKWWPATFVGGLVYEFSPFMVGQAQSHLFLIFIPLPPIIAALSDALFVRRSHVVRNGILLGLVVAAQFMISAEVLGITLFATALTLLVMAALHPVATRERARDIVRGAAAAIATAVVLASYPLWIYFRGPYHVSGAPHPLAELESYESSLGSLIYPTNLERFGFGSWLAKGMALTLRNGVETTTYIGIPLLVLLAYIVVRCRRVAHVQVFTLVAVGAWVITLGAERHGVRLPYDLITKIPLLNGALDLRYSLLIYAGLSVVVAIGLDRMNREGVFAGFRRARPVVAAAPQLPGDAPSAPFSARRQLARSLGCLGVFTLALLPLLPALPYASTPSGVPALFTAATTPLRSGSIVLSYPLPIGYEGFNDQALLWQAASGMRFRLIAFRGAVSDRTDSRPLRQAALLLPPYAAEKVLVYLLYGRPSPPPPNDTATAKDIRIFLRRYKVGAVTVVRQGRPIDQVLAYFTAALRVRPVEFLGSYIWPDVQKDLRRLISA
jgi:hypothetical protein